MNGHIDSFLTGIKTREAGRDAVTLAFPAATGRASEAITTEVDARPFIAVQGLKKVQVADFLFHLTENRIDTTIDTIFPPERTRHGSTGWYVSFRAGSTPLTEVLAALKAIGVRDPYVDLYGRDRVCFVL